MVINKALAIRALVVAGMGALLLTSPVHAESMTSQNCDFNICTNAIELCLPSLCFNCGNGISTQCEVSSGCPTDAPYHIYCGYEQ
jgi:hypothetical protein